MKMEGGGENAARGPDTPPKKNIASFNKGEQIMKVGVGKGPEGAQSKSLGDAKGGEKRKGHGTKTDSIKTNEFEKEGIERKGRQCENQHREPRGGKKTPRNGDAVRVKKLGREGNVAKALGVC